MPYEKTKKICPVCKKEYLGRPLQKYCSYDCVNKSGITRKPRRGKYLKCKICCKEFYRKPFETLTAKYCSYKCASIAKQNREKRICRICGRVIERPMSAFYWSKKRGNNHFYCSVKCSAKGSSKNNKGIVRSKLWSMRKADQTFSDYIRNRDGWKCRYCGKSFIEKTGQLHNSHFWGRDRWSTRFVPENCIALCYACHKWKLENEKQGAYKQIMIDWLGQEKYDLLEKKSNIIVSKRDSILEFMNWIKPHLKDMNTIKKRGAMIENEFGMVYLD